ncbi:hypothetical protein SRB5_37350 [Streptomyces sp. RB5]|uniref:UPF0182 protein SRB5_37350 n=2 Tax=Streptomyces smaragdinus TaxID=2585196 RepID=A0A7K0CJE6_9ACTN|nr:hypothetical protein [Streptomyces smaragdinus]
MTLGALAVLAIIFVMFAGFWTDWLWYRSVNYSSVFTTQLWTKIGLFFVFGGLMALAVGLNIWLAHRLRPPLSAMSLEQESLDRYRMNIAPYKKWLLIGIALLIGLISGASAAGQWRTWLMWVNGVSFHQSDPQFHKDISFYAFDLPWYRFLLGFGFAAVVLSLIAAALVHYLYGGLRVSSPGARATSQATGHLAVLLGVFVGLKAVAYWLDRYGLAVKSSGLRSAHDWTGLRYVDANAYLPAKTILFAIAIICSLLFFATLWRRTWQLPLIGLGLMALSAILIGGLYPAIVQNFQVKPNEQAKEAPFIAKNLKATKAAYGIDEAQVEDYSGEGDKPDDALRQDVDRTASIRLLDPNIVSGTFQQQQQVRSYYQFPGTLDVDRYGEQDTVVGLRELNVSGIEAQKSWINTHFRYTHGFGVVAAKGTEVTSIGAPSYTESELPPVGQLGDYEPRVYYGEKTSQYSIVGGPQTEIDYIDKGGNEKEYSYAGTSGVSLSNPVNRLAYALSFSEPQIMYSGAIGDGSRILYNRTPKQRVEAVAPWLTIDGDPYPAVVDGRIQWIVDAYTTINNYPYASRTTLGDTTSDSLTNVDDQRSLIAQQNKVNYIRNSVKATVDAYSGDVKLYEWDTEDPVLKTWKKAFPGTVEPRSAISDDLMNHLRYPQDLFKVQRELLTQYHVKTANQFYSGSERWAVPNDPTRDRSEAPSAVPPYYLSMRMPGQEDREFSLTTTFTPNGRDNLGAFMAVNADATSSGYGTIRVLKLPSTNPVDGPKQVQSKFNADQQIAETIRLLRGGDSEVEYGNLLTVPLGGGLMYIEPVYVRGKQVDLPLLKKVLVRYGDDMAFEDNLDEALDVIFGAKEPTTGGPEEPEKPEKPAEEPPANQSLEDAVQDAVDAMAASDDALAKKDLKGFADAQEDLRKALERAEAAREKAGGRQ